jgi:hypothetical protein
MIMICICLVLLSLSAKHIFGQSCQSSVNEISFIFVKSHANDSEVIALNNTQSLLHNAAYDSKKSTVIYCFGYTELYESPSTQLIVNAFLMRRDHNILVFNWSSIDAGNYFLDAVPNAVKAGQLLGQVIVDMAQQGFNISKFHLIGHSLGSHIFGYAGRAAITISHGTVTIPWMTGLDPSGPGFYPLNPYLYPINKHDALFVNIIHTNSQLLGGNLPTGHVDFWPNGGAIQVGCPPFDSLNLFKRESKH